MDQGCLHLHPLVQVPMQMLQMTLHGCKLTCRCPTIIDFRAKCWLHPHELYCVILTPGYSWKFIQCNIFSENGGISLDFYWYWWRQMLLCVCLGWCLNSKPLVCKWDTLWWDQVHTVSPVSSAFEVYFTYFSQMFMAIAFSNSLR